MKINKNSSSFNLLFSIFNKLLFKNQLPTVVVLITKIADKDIRGFFSHKDQKPLGIVISKDDPEPVKVLLHEMCHVKIASVDGIWEEDDHGPEFVKLLESVYKKVGLEIDPFEIT